MDRPLQALEEAREAAIALCNAAERPADAAAADRYLVAASLNLRAARIGVTLAGSAHRAKLHEALGADDAALDHAAMSLAIEDAVTCLDLCAAAAARVADIPERRSGRAHAVGTLQKALDTSDSPIGRWLTSFASETWWKYLIRWRHTVVHRDYTRRGTEMRIGHASPWQPGPPGIGPGPVSLEQQFDARSLPSATHQTVQHTEACVTAFNRTLQQMRE
jgi:hypothetical protein